MAQTSDAPVASTITPATKTKKPKRSKVSTDSPSTPAALIGHAQRVLTEADIIAFHLSRTSTPAGSPSGSTLKSNGKPALPSSSKLRISLLPPNAHSQLTIIPLSSTSRYKIPARAFSMTKPGKRSPLADSSTLPEVEPCEVPPSDPFSLPQPTSSTLPAVVPEQKVKKARKSKSVAEPVKSPKKTKRPRGDSKSSEGRTSDIIPPLSDDEGYDQLISSQPAQPSTSPVNRVLNLDVTPTAPTTGSGEQPTPTLKGKSKGKRKSVIEDLPFDGEEPGTGKTEKKKRKSKAADVEPPIMPTAPTEQSEVSKDKEEKKRKKKSKVEETSGAVELPAPVEASAAERPVEKKKRKSKAVTDEVPVAVATEVDQVQPVVEQSEKLKKKSNAADANTDADGPVNAGTDVALEKPKKRKKDAEATTGVDAGDAGPKEKKAKKSKKVEGAHVESVEDGVNAASTEGVVEKKQKKDKGTKVATTNTADPSDAAAPIEPAKAKSGSKKKKSTVPSWQVGTPVASSPPGP